MPVYSLKKRRESAKLSQRALAKKLGMHQARVSRIENGLATPSLAQAVIIEKLFGIPCRWWVRGEVRKALR